MLGVTLQCTNIPSGVGGEVLLRTRGNLKMRDRFVSPSPLRAPCFALQTCFSRIGSTNPGADKKRTRCTSIITWWWLFLSSLCLFIYFFVLNRQLCYIFQCLHNQHALHRSVLNCDNEMCALKTILSKSERNTLQSLWVRLEVTIIHKPRIQNRLLPPDLLSVKRSPPSTNLLLKKNLEKSQFHKWTAKACFK